jgi:hypothetical protein
MARAVAWCAALAALLACVPARAELDLDETLFRDKRIGVRMSIPEGWTPSTQTGYPALLLVLQRPDASISLASGWLASGGRLAEHVAGNASAMRRAGLLVLASRPGPGRSGWELSARREDGVREVRQLFVTNGGGDRRVFILTLVAAPARIAALAPELHAVAKSVEIH